ncbi:MAG TPA: universal stress protein [Gemmatimonadaceae bacterium]
MSAPQQMSARVASRHAAHRPILVAIGPTGGAHTFRVARAIASRDTSPLVVASVVEPPPVYALHTNNALLLPWLVDQQIDERRTSVRDRLHRLTGEQTPELRVEVRYGEPGIAISELASELDARLIVMGIGPYAVRHRLFSTGTVWQTSHRASRPVLAVSERARGLARVAVVATDFSPESITAARAALPLLADGATLHVVHVWRRVAAAFPSAELARLNERYAASLPEQFDRFRTALGRCEGIVVETHALEGSPAEVLLAMAQARQAELIVAGTHGRGMVERWLLGSTSSALLRAAECSVLLAPAPAVVERLALVRHMDGTSSLRAASEWDAELSAFVRRNRDRPTMLEIDDPTIGAQVQETGLALVGAAYDSHDHRVALMFAGRIGPDVHFTRTLGDVRSLAVSSDWRDVDNALYIESAGGGTLLTFLDEARAISASANA